MARNLSPLGEQKLDLSVAYYCVDIPTNTVQQSALDTK